MIRRCLVAWPKRLNRDRAVNHRILDLKLWLRTAIDVFAKVLFGSSSERHRR